MKRKAPADVPAPTTVYVVERRPKKTFDGMPNGWDLEGFVFLRQTAARNYVAWLRLDKTAKFRVRPFVRKGKP